MSLHDKRKLADDDDDHASNKQPVKKLCRGVEQYDDDADDWVERLRVEKRRDVCNLQLFGLIQPTLAETTLVDRTKYAMRLIEEDNNLDQPLMSLDYRLHDGNLMLGEFIQFMKRCAQYYVGKEQPALDILKEYASSIAMLLARKSSNVTAQQQQQHPTEQCALLLFTRYSRAIEENSTTIIIADALLKRGSSIHARDPDGNMPIHNWCCSSQMQSACGIIRLLEAGADLDDSLCISTPLWTLCRYTRVQVLRELIVAGWLDTNNLQVSMGMVDSTPMEYLQSQFDSRKEGVAAASKEMYELLYQQQQRWNSMIRPRLFSLLSTHEQLIPDLAQVVLSYIEGTDKSPCS